MTVLKRIDAAAMPGATSLYVDFISKEAAPVHRRLPSFRFAGAWEEALGRRVSVDRALVDEVRSYNQTLGVGASLLSKLDGLVDGTVRAVVTGQQPGVVGGPLLSLYKAATAVTLARHVESVHGRACVPVFWLGSDDDDFSEVRELSVIGNDYSRLDVSLDTSAYRPGLRIGDMSSAAVRAAWNAIAPMLPPGVARDRLSAAVAAAGDFADGAARALVAATAGEIIVVDARARELRLAGRDLLLAFFDREDELRASLVAESAALQSEGYHAQVQWGSDSGLFVVDNGVRQRVPPEQRSAARARIERDIGVVAPGVVARNLLQDSVLGPVAVVLGPAEIAYRAQMADIYRTLAVTMPVVAPRLSATYLPPAIRDLLAATAIDAAGMVIDPAGVTAAVNAASVDDGLKAAASQLESVFAGGSRAFLVRASARLDERSRQKLEKRIDDITARLAQALAAAIEQDVAGPRARWPFLSRMAEMFRKDGEMQERFLSLTTPMLFHGDDAWRAIDSLAREWAPDALDGRVWHGVYSV